MDPDDNAVSPRPESCRSVFELGFKAWSCCSQRVSRGAKQDALEVLRVVDHAFPGHPALPSSLKLTKSADCWVATGISFWDAGTGPTFTDSSSSTCTHTLPGIAPQKHSFPVTKSKPTKLTLVDSSECGLLSLFGDEDDHMTILILAWAFILSARWTEIIPGTEVKYNEVRAESTKHKHSTITVPIGTMSGEAARWWKAVLDPGQGWLATAENDGRTLWSPWYITLSSRTTLVPVFLGHSPTPAPTPNSATALQYLSEYVTMNSIVDQSRAALSAVLCLPFANRSSSKISLPAPSITTRITTSQQSKRSPPFSLAQVDKLLTLSCNARGLEAMLLSCFFNPTVPCNLVSSFLQGTFAALDYVSQDPLLLILALLRRSPTVGFLWVGAAVLGAHLPLLEKARHGGFEIELHSAVWTGTVQTFMQLPVSATLSGRIRREDECRLAYLVSKDYQHNLPLFPWKPFGTIDLKDAELDVQIHGDCQGHGLRYRGWAWDCWQGRHPVSVTHHPPELHGTEYEPASAPHGSVEVPYELLDLEDDSASCTATLNIFMWLRRAGFAASEQHIRRHEWLCEVLDDEEEEAYESWPEDEEDSVRAPKKRPKSAAPRPKLGGWLASTQARREDSV
ncbi:hypothetical protein diail_10524 [Diaporthe ilicicola]|nr:hypothetical protein diail_10524 [Diaporthe ilicicola]